MVQLNDGSTEKRGERRELLGDERIEIGALTTLTLHWERSMPLDGVERRCNLPCRMY